MSIYGKESYSQSKIVFLAGPIEAWWNTEEEPNKFNSPEANAYFMYRGILEERLKERGYLVYKPHHSFGGNWNEKAQVVNDSAIAVSDILIRMTPPGVDALGTDHEVSTARSFGIPIIYGPPPSTNPRSLIAMGNQASAVVDAVDRAIESVLD